MMHTCAEIGQNLNPIAPIGNNWAWIRCGFKYLQCRKLPSEYKMAAHSLLFGLVSLQIWCYYLWFHLDVAFIVQRNYEWSWIWSELSKFNFLKQQYRYVPVSNLKINRTLLIRTAFSDSAIYCVIDDISLMISDKHTNQIPPTTIPEATKTLLRIKKVIFFLTRMWQYTIVGSGMSPDLYHNVFCCNTLLFFPQLYYEVKRVLADRPDLIEEFTAFMPPEVALQCGVVRTPSNGQSIKLSIVP